MTSSCLLHFFCTLTFLVISSSTSFALGIFADDFYVSWGGADHARTIDGGHVMQLMLNQSSAAGFASRHKYLYGSIDMQIKLISGNSAGTVTAYYLSSDSIYHDELDFEFLGNLSRKPYILQTNVFSKGVGGREQRIYLWFDPTAHYHTYSVLWNEQHITFSVDGIPIREFANNEAVGVPYLSKQHMRIYSSIWNGDSWATRGGRVKIDWSQAPFVASYRNYTLDACGEAANASCPLTKWWNHPTYHTLDTEQEKQLLWVERNYMIYNYCTDVKRNPIPPAECPQ